MNVLVLTDVLPAPILTNKQRENDVLITTADVHEQLHPDVHYTFVFVVTYSNFLFSLFSEKWAELKRFRELGSYQYRNRNIEIISVPNIREKGLFKSVLIPMAYLLNRRRLKRIIDSKKIDLVHAHNIKSEAGLAFHLQQEFKIPYVITTRKLGKIAPDNTIKAYLSNARALINLGHAQLKLSLQYNPRSYVVPHGIDKRFLQQVKDYQKGSKPFKIVSLCRLLNWKNIDKVFKALDHVNRDFVYDIYGDGPDLQRLKQLVSKMRIRTKVHFKGYIPYEEVPDMLVQYDLFILPSYREMFGRVYIEAMACGLPVVGARNCGVDGYIEEGVQGFLVNHQDTQELTNVINKLIREENLKITMGQEAKVLSANFMWGKIIEKIDHIYRESVS